MVKELICDHRDGGLFSTKLTYMIIIKLKIITLTMVYMIMFFSNIYVVITLTLGLMTNIKAWIFFYVGF
jgi:hypothetical protein